MNVSECRKALAAILTPRVFPVFVLTIYYQMIGATRSSETARGMDGKAAMS
jgi:hypothetical protein